MAFGNPYEDSWSMEIRSEFIRTLKKMGVKIIPLLMLPLKLMKKISPEDLLSTDP